MAFKMKKTPELVKVVKELRGAVKAHKKQADIIESHLKYKKDGTHMSKYGHDSHAKYKDSSYPKYVSDAQRKAAHASMAEKGIPKKLIGDQDELPEELKAKIEAAPETPLAKKSKGRKVSWKYGGKTYYGTLIPSMETSTHRYARTHNGKIKSLPKKKKK
jgi:hypothetical protein